jgi:hypothetical protein
MQSDRPTPGVVTIRVRNVTIPNIRCTRLSDGEYDIPFVVSDVRVHTPRQHRKAIQQNWYPEAFE